MYINPVLLPCCWQIGIFVCCGLSIEAEYRNKDLYRGKGMKVFSVWLVSL